MFCVCYLNEDFNCAEYFVKRCTLLYVNCYVYHFYFCISDDVCAYLLFLAERFAVNILCIIVYYQGIAHSDLTCEISDAFSRVIFFFNAIKENFYVLVLVVLKLF